MATSDRDRWNQRWRQRAGDGDAMAAPSSFVVGAGPVLPRSGRAVDLAGGAGRHALWLAGSGLEVTLVDISDEALALVPPHVHRQRLDFDVDEPPAGPWDVVLIFH